jgi:recombination protein RecT
MATRTTQLANFRQLFERSDVLAQFHRAIRPGHDIDAKTVARIALTTLTDEKNAKLLQCTQQSVCASIVTALALGLEPDNVSGLAYLVPYKDKCTLIPGYRGLIQLAYRSGQVANFSTYNVYSNETFVHNCGAKEEIHHEPKPPSTRGKYIGSYAKVELNTGGVHIEWMWDEQIETIRKRAPAGTTGPWKTDVGEMRRKTVARRACKYIPSSPTLQRMVALDEQVERGAPQNLDVIDVEPIGEPAAAAPKTPTLDDFAAKDRTDTVEGKLSKTNAQDAVDVTA